MDTQHTYLKNLPHCEADIVITFPHDAKETTVLWFKQRIEEIPGVALEVRSLAMSVHCSKTMTMSRTNGYVFCLKATYECYLRGLELMHIPKIVKDELGGGTKEFIFKDRDCFKNIEDIDCFFTSQERQSILLHVLNRLRAQEGNLYSTSLFDAKFIS